ncbi:uncharacterized protein LOC124450925 [Xenia sp. Carnegie-2017]|uniref:uncharacterized protein LOC124450925 n=1 Tax=Xenia sp. Carnegie-2017 TaxID=2897299 RepID=UPI001F04D630|nr:uncharacterized protein LOC124450925 [Xenia sp. Carnegie-2017]
MAYCKEIISFLLLQSLLINFSLCNIIKRKAPEGKLYVFSKREGCVFVQSESPCTLNWKLNPYIAKVYTQKNKIVSHALNYYAQLGISYLCRNAVKKALCSQWTPRCSESDYSRDYGDVTRLCNKVYSRCPSDLVNDLKNRKFCKILKKGRHSNDQCVANTAPISGACPQPKYKMTSWLLEEYQTTSVRLQPALRRLRNQRYRDGRRIYSDSCVSQITEIDCSAIYCSANETELLVKMDRDDCHQVISDCVDEPFRRLSKSTSAWNVLNTLRNQLKTNCDTFAAPSSDLRPEPPRSYKKSPTKKSEDKPKPSATRNTPTSTGNREHKAIGILPIVFFALMNMLLIA